ncbi:conserved protein of unknown function [[Clostridium] ultunense Esp]|uniref:Transposase n=1 Tax=[Clostridium] ultunense Esp TaxID=1288971 RepID=A0A1M4PKC6_9FIRM|nr:conserved protein of unknown function [[Clostridium] ultunense Esp]
MKGGDTMKNKTLTTLFVDIDVSSKSITLCALDHEYNKLLNLKALNNQPGAESILDSIIKCLNSKQPKICCYCLRIYFYL